MTGVHEDAIVESVPKYANQKGLNMEYRDFEVDIRSTRDDQFEAVAVTTPGRPRSSFPRPLSYSALKQLAEAVNIEVLAASRSKKRRAKGKKKVPKPREMGQALFTKVFTGDLGEAFQAALHDDDSTGLRVRLTFDLNDKEADYLATLPWELLSFPNGEYLAKTIRTPVVRRLLNSHGRRTLDVDGTLCILVVDAAPTTMKSLDLLPEMQRIEEALRPLVDDGDLEILQPPEPTLEAMRHTLRDQPVHVLHFMGHGGYHEGSKMGAVYFETDDKKADQVDGEMLGDALKDIRSLRLVVLNSCYSARHAGLAGAPLYHGVASGIVERTGVPAVVANQYTISDQAAIRFSRTFYRRLAAGDGVDTAMSEARLQMGWRTSEWSTPVLFMSAANGTIFQRATPGVQSYASRPRWNALKPLRAGVRSFIGWGRDLTRHRPVCDLTEFFDPDSHDGRLIRDSAWWQQRVFPTLRNFLLNCVDENRPLRLDFAAHQSIAFAAGWVLEAKSGLTVAVKQRTQGHPLDWSPDDGSAPEGSALEGGELWLPRPDVELTPEGPDVALVLTISNPEIAEEVEIFLRAKVPSVGRIIDATIAPEPSQTAVAGGQHALRLAQALVHRARQRRPQERGRRLHIFGAAPNALLFYLGQLSRSFGHVVLYEYAFNYPDRYARYQKSIELPSPDEVPRLPQGW